MVHWLDVRALLTANAVLTIDVTLGTSAKLVTNVLEIGYRMTPTTSLITEMHAVVARTLLITASAVLTIDVTLGTIANLVTNVLEIGYRPTPTTSTTTIIFAVVAKTILIIVFVIIINVSIKSDSSTQEESATMEKLKAMTIVDLTIAKTFFPTQGLIEIQIHLDRLIKFTSVE